MRSKTTRTYQLTDLTEKQIVLLAQAMTTLLGKKMTQQYYANPHKDNDAIGLQQYLQYLAEEIPFGPPRAT